MMQLTGITSAFGGRQAWLERCEWPGRSDLAGGEEGDRAAAKQGSCGAGQPGEGSLVGYGVVHMQRVPQRRARHKHVRHRPVLGPASHTHTTGLTHTYVVVQSCMAGSPLP